MLFLYTENCYNVCNVLNCVYCKKKEYFIYSTHFKLTGSQNFMDKLESMSL